VHTVAPSSLLQLDRSHTQAEYEFVTILEVVVSMGAEESRPRSFILCNYRAIMEVSSSDDQSTSAKCTVRDIQKSSQMCIQAHDNILEVLVHINVYLSTRQPQNIGFPNYAGTGFFLSKMVSILVDGEHSFQIIGWIALRLSEFDCCTAGKDKNFADAHPRQQRKNGSRHGHQECTSHGTPSSSTPKAILQ